MTNSWDDVANTWDENPQVRVYADKAYQTLCASVDISGLHILDFGCGTGLLTEKMSSKASHILAVDSAEKMLAVLRNKSLTNVDVLSVELSEQAIQQQALLQSGFDLIVASSVCAFLPNYPASLKLLSSLLNVGGKFIQWDWLKTEADQAFALSELAVSQAFAEAGLETLSISQAFSMGGEEEPMPVLMAIAKKI